MAHSLETTRQFIARAERQLEADDGAISNRRSRAVCERLGLVSEGVLRDAERMGDSYHDLVVHSVIEREWRARSRRRAPRGSADSRPEFRS